MRAPGWFWWGWLLLLPLLIAGAVGVIWLSSLVEPLSLASEGTWTLVGMVGLLCLTFMLLALGKAIGTRRCYRPRMAALYAAKRGQFGEPLTEAAPVDGLPMLTDEPLTVLWHCTRRWRWLIGFIAGFSAMYVYSGAQNIVGLLIDTGYLCGQAFARFSDHLDLVLAVLVPLALIVFLAIIVQALVGRPFGVVADDDGIEMLRVLGRQRRVRWDDAILFERTTADDRYILYGRHGYVTWAWERKPKVIVPLGITDDEAAARGHTLVLLTQERTRLAPQFIVK